jgi:chromosome partitioning protein
LRTIAVVNQKGGSGKTTTAVNAGAALAEAGSRVLVVDLDPQASATAWLGAEAGQQDLLRVFTEGVSLESIVQPTRIGGLELVPSSTWLIGVEKSVAHEVGAEFLLRSALEGVG